jgi:ligand-binding sensor domain-containing protein
MPLRILIKISLLLFLITSHSEISNAQTKNIHFNHITVNDGLLSDLVRDFYQDSKGFIWIANDTEGVLKYDGYTFTPYTNLHSYNTNQIVCVPYTIAEDQRGLMWFGTTNGVDILDPTTDKFIHYLPDSFVVLSESKNVVYKIFVDRQNVIWIGTRDGIIRLTEKEPLEIVSPEMIIKNGVDSSFNVEYFKFFPEDTSHNTNRVYEIYEDQYNNLMLLGYTGLFVFHREKEQFIRIDDDPEGRSRLYEGMFRGILEDDYGNYWITTANGVFRMQNFNSFVDDSSFDKSKIQFQSFYPSPAINGNFFRTISRDNNGDIWLGGLWSGLYLVKENNSIEPQFFHFPKKLSAVNSILDNQLLTLYTDHNDNLWIGHKRVGVDKFSTRNPGFKSYSGIVEKHFMGAHLLPIIEDRKGDIWIGETGTGLYKFSSNNEENISVEGNWLSIVFLIDAVRQTDRRTRVIWIWASRCR